MIDDRHQQEMKLEEMQSKSMKEVNQPLSVSLNHGVYSFEKDEQSMFGVSICLSCKIKVSKICFPCALKLDTQNDD